MSHSSKQTLKEGYEKFVVKNNNGCWSWKGCHANPGYGQFRYGMKKERAHRASWIIHFGEIPKGKFVLHKCDNKICSNPEHLFLGTNLDNIKDMISKKRHPTIGIKNNTAGAKLTIEQIKEIRNSANITNKELAKKYNVHYVTIGLIKNRSSWKNI